MDRLLYIHVRQAAVYCRQKPAAAGLYNMTLLIIPFVSCVYATYGEVKDTEIARCVQCACRLGSCVVDSMSTPPTLCNQLAYTPDVADSSSVVEV